MFKNLFFLVISIFMLIGCGGGGGDNNISNLENTQVISGKVADGYIVGANICLDLNHNDICDSNEPKTQTTNGGRYTLNIDSSINISQYACVVEVPVGAVDEDDGLPIQKPYTLSAPKGTIEFISPVSTIIKTIQNSESLTLEQAKTKYKEQIGLNDNAIDIMDNYIDSTNIDDTNKEKIHNIAKVTAKLMSENQQSIFSSLDDSGLKNSQTQQKSLQAINKHIINQLPAISDIDEVTDESINNLQSKINLPTLYADLELSQTQQNSFAGALADNTKDDIVVAIDSCSGEVLGDGTSLGGITYCIDIDGEKVSKNFTVTQEEQDTLIYIKDLIGQVEFSLYKKNGDAYEKINLPFFRSTQDGKLYMLGGKGSNLPYQLASGEYKIEFDENNWVSSEASATVNIISEVTDKVHVEGTVSSKVKVNPYLLSSNETKTIKGTLHSVFDFDSKDKLIDIIPLRTQNSTLQANFELKGNAYIEINGIQINLSDFDVQVVNASYFSKILFPTMVLENDGVLFSGKASELTNKKFILAKQTNEDDAYFVIISTPFDNEYPAYYLNNIFSKYELVVQTSDLLDATLSVGTKEYKASIKQSNISQLLNPINIKHTSGTSVPDDEFYTSMDTAKQFTSSLQTLHSVVNFDEGSMMRFYDSYIKQINAINSAQNSMTVTESLTSLAINVFTFDVKGLSVDLLGLGVNLDSMDNIQRAESLGRIFLDYGFEILRDYHTKKKVFITKYNSEEMIVSDENLSSENLSELSKLYVLQQRATLFLQYGMDIYLSTTNLEERTIFEYFRDRVIAIGLSFFPDSAIKTTAGYLNIVNSLGGNLIDQFQDSVAIEEFEYSYKEMWEQLLSIKNYHSFYSESTQANNIDLLKASSYTFEEVIEDVTAPTVSFSDYPIGTITSTDPFTLTLTWSEDVIGFDSSDITVTGGIKGTFTKISNNVYTLEVTPNDNSTTELSVQVFMYKVQDNASNIGIGTITTSVNVNTIPNVVIDSITGLMWQNNIHITKTKLPLVTNINFQAGGYFDTSSNTAVTYCNELLLEEYSDWRLPSKDELYKIVTENSVVLENDYAEYFWSSTTNYNYGQGYAWVVRFDGSIDTNFKNNNNSVRCVRDISYTSGVITHNGVTYGTVTSPYTGRVWLDRNLGASQVCAAPDEVLCYGDYYQWGRNTDGHEKSNSTITSTKSSDLDNIGFNFIAGFIPDWTTVDSDGALRSDNWNKIDGTSVCPVGYRVPTKTELTSEILLTTLGFSNNADPYNNFLKLASSNYRDGNNGFIVNSGVYGELWTSSSEINYGDKVLYNNSWVDAGGSTRTFGLPVRCIKD